MISHSDRNHYIVYCSNSNLPRVNAIDTRLQFPDLVLCGLISRQIKSLDTEFSLEIDGVKIDETQRQAIATVAMFDDDVEAAMGRTVCFIDAETVPTSVTRHLQPLLKKALFVKTGAELAEKLDLISRDESIWKSLMSMQAKHLRTIATYGDYEVMRTKKFHY